MNEILSLSLDDFINAPSKAESVLDLLTSEQILAIEQTLGQVKKRRLTAKKSISVTPIKQQQQQQSTSNEPVTEIKDGVEWVSFVYSHNRTLKRYSIRTDLDQVDIALIDTKFKTENCVYPRANAPKEEYTGNRWNYETECNELGWKLAWLNKDDLEGKRGLIQRAVDSYRNRYPNMRSRRVARQEKLLNGTLRKRKHRETECTTESISLPSAHHPKTIAIEDVNHQRFRIKINIESVDLEEINIEFRKANSPFPRVLNMSKPAINSQRWTEETMCNELAWKLAWLNPRHLAGKKNMLQRALDMYRSKFMPSLQPRKNSSRNAPIPMPVLQSSPAMSNMSGTTASLDFADCFSLTDEESTDTLESTDAAAFCDLLLQEYCSTTTATSTSTPDPVNSNNDFFDQFMMSNSDPFLTSDISQLYNTQLLF